MSKERHSQRSSSDPRYEQPKIRDSPTLLGSGLTPRTKDAISSGAGGDAGGLHWVLLDVAIALPNAMGPRRKTRGDGINRQ